ncbi:hypothetical protein [Agarilytica rhodophyticola]|uniref:hypothetical protein n=1 Tax=Agarilytica rhodophyticola TaxID=1737490 RepID=UPI000B345BCC|nr:hypothetical protein [Agarilytica rhodophyticola]
MVCDLKSLRSICILTSASFIIAACGGSGGGGSPTPTPVPPDTTPNTFTLTPSGGAEISTVITSDAITVAGINAATAISVAGGEYSINSGTFTAAAGTVTNGQMVQVRGTSSDMFDQTATVRLTIGGVSGDFVITTRMLDTTPDAFTFTAATGAALSAVVTSNAITVAGIDNSAPISITDGEYSIDSGTFTTSAGTVDDGQSVQVRRTSSSTVSTDVSTTLDIGGVTSTFTITTLADGTDPQATIAFPPPVSMTEGTTVNIRGTASDDTSGVSSVMVNGVAATATGPNGTFDTWEIENLPLTADSDNTLNVVVSDAAGNSTTTSVMVKSDTAMGDFPDSNNPLSFPSGIAFDSARNLIYISDRDLKAIFSVNLMTGVREILSDNMTQNISTPLDLPEGLLIDETNEILWVSDALAGTIFEVRLNGGLREVKSSSTVPDSILPFSAPREMILDPNDASRLLVSDQNFGITTMNIAGGGRTVFSSQRPDRGPVPSTDTSNRILNARGIVFDDADNRLFLVDSQLLLIYSLDPLTGARTIFSDAMTPAFDDPRTLVIDRERNRLLVNNDGAIDGLIEVDLDTGTRLIFSDSTTPDNVNAFSQPEEIHYDDSLGYAFVVDRILDAVLAVDIVSGERVFISRGDSVD